MKASVFQETAAAARRFGVSAQALINEFTQGDPAMFKAVTGVKKEMMGDPDLARHMPPAGVMEFLGKVFAASKK